MRKDVSPEGKSEIAKSDQIKAECETGRKQDARQGEKQINTKGERLLRGKNTAAVTNVLEDYKDLQRLSGIRCEGKGKFITTVVDQHGVEKYDRKDVANVFADFFETLYRDTEQNWPHDESLEEMPAVPPG